MGHHDHEAVFMNAIPPRHCWCGPPCCLLTTPAPVEINHCLKRLSLCTWFTIQESCNRRCSIYLFFSWSLAFHSYVYMRCCSDVMSVPPVPWCPVCGITGPRVHTVLGEWELMSFSRGTSCGVARTVDHVDGGTDDHLDHDGSQPIHSTAPTRHVTVTLSLSPLPR